MYFRESEVTSTPDISKTSMAALVLSAVAVIWLGIMPSFVINLAQGLF